LFAHRFRDFSDGANDGAQPVFDGLDRLASQLGVLYAQVPKTLRAAGRALARPAVAECELGR
jgi:hypothetical protein